MAEQGEDVKKAFMEKPEGLDLSALYKPGSATEVQDRSFHLLFPSVRKLVALFKKCEHLAKTGELNIRCAVCKEAKMARGWDPLLVHAKKYWKSYPHQHRGYYRALKQAFRAENLWPERADPVVWPPVLLADDADPAGIRFEGRLRRWRGLNGDESLPRSLRDLQLQHVLAVYRKKNGGRGFESPRGALVFPASQVGRIEAKRIDEVLGTGASREDLNLRLSDGGTRDSGRSSESQSEAGSESECGEDHRPLAIRTPVNQIRKMERAAEVVNKWRRGLGQRGCSRAILKSEQLRRMVVGFRKDLESMGPRCALAGDEYQLQMTEKQLRKEKLQWLKDIRQVKEQFETTEDIVRITEAQRELERQFETIRKKNYRRSEGSELQRDELENHRRHLKEVEYKKLKQVIWLGTTVYLLSSRSRSGPAECHMLVGKKQEMRENQKRCEALVEQWEYEEEAFRRQAEIAKHRKDILSSLCKEYEVGELVLQQIYDRFKAEYDGISDPICKSPREEVGVGKEDCPMGSA